MPEYSACGHIEVRSIEVTSIEVTGIEVTGIEVGVGQARHGRSA